MAGEELRVSGQRGTAGGRRSDAVRAPAAAPRRLDMSDADDRLLPLNDWHVARGARMVSFAGYAMPIQYEGIMAEHRWTRESAGLFDVSHMGQLIVIGAEAE